MSATERWGIHEVVLSGPREGNPFLEVTLAAVFRHGHREVRVEGFYDGEGTYRIRFLPDEEGAWEYVTESGAPALAGKTGSFLCTPALRGNHGPVGVARTFHFVHADGTPHVPIGTTCYAWNHQGDALEERTLATLRASPFNKMRMCVFPKHYLYNENEPPLHAFEKGADGSWDFTRFVPAFFRRLERRVGDLRDMGIQADLILFHPYDRWGYADMGAEADDRYLRYLVARLSAYRNVWWSFANEYDLMKGKSTADWDRLFRLVASRDPYSHPRSIHNCRGFYDHAKPWVTHASVQHEDLVRVTEWRAAYGKPVVVDECCYEGNIHRAWGNITAREMTRRIWEGTVRGGYVGHGETFVDPGDVLWWSKGGTLHGQSPERIAFLKSVLEAMPGPHEYTDRFTARYPALQCGDGDAFLIYLGDRQPVRMELALPSGRPYRAEILDTWQMTVRAVEGPVRAVTPGAGTKAPPDSVPGAAVMDLPGKPYMAIRLTAV